MPALVTTEDADDFADGFAETAGAITRVFGFVGIGAREGNGILVQESCGKRFGQFGGITVGVLNVNASFLMGLPVVKAALLPFSEIGGADRLRVEMGFKDIFDFGDVVEPIDEGDAWFAIVEALVEFVANVAWETGDFTSAGHELVVG